jgi:hypothetical protein
MPGPNIERIEIMNTRIFLVLAGTSLLAGCVYPYQPYGYAAPGYSSATTYYPGYQQPYQQTYQPAQATYQSYPYRAAPYAYPLYSPQYPQSGVGGNGS